MRFLFFVPLIIIVVSYFFACNNAVSFILSGFSFVFLSVLLARSILYKEKESPSLYILAILFAILSKKNNIYLTQESLGEIYFWCLVILALFGLYRLYLFFKTLGKKKKEV